MNDTFYVGIGSNLSDEHGRPSLQLCRESVTTIVATIGCDLIGVSYWYATAPIPASAQPDFVNGVIALEAAQPPRELLQILQQIEQRAGRVRGEKNAARVLDLDLIACGDVVLPVRGSDNQTLILPHPRMAERAFVLHPLCDIAPDWSHPILGLTARQLRDRIADQRILRLSAPNEGLP